MTIYISLLRGINVSGQKKVKMTELKALYESLGLQSVVTYIQSGNVIFKSNKNAEILKGLLEQAIEQHFSFQVPVNVITKDHFLIINKQLPFTDIDLELDGTKVLITFLSASPKSELTEKLMTYVKAPEKLIISDKVIFLHCPNGYGKTKLSNNFIENKLKVVTTTRNLKTLVKLSTLMLTH
jgi:uncharacterized protein (DUF1697 family)